MCITHIACWVVGRISQPSSLDRNALSTPCQQLWHTPSGLILALLLSRADPPIQVALLEAADDLDTNPRAAHYAPSACYELNRAGVLDEVREEGFHPNSVCWRKPDGTLLGGLSWSSDEIKIESGPMVCLPLDRLDRLLLQHLVTYPTAEVLFKHRVLNLGQDEAHARVQVQISAEDGRN